MKVALLVLLGLVTLSTADRPLDSQLSTLKKLLRKALESRGQVDNPNGDESAKPDPALELTNGRSPSSLEHMVLAGMPPKKLQGQDRPKGSLLPGQLTGGHGIKHRPQKSSKLPPGLLHKPHFHPMPQSSLLDKHDSNQVPGQHRLLTPQIDPQDDMSQELLSENHGVISGDDDTSVLHEAHGHHDVSGHHDTSGHHCTSGHNEVSGNYDASGHHLSIPLHILAFIMSSPNMQAAPLTPDDLSEQVADFVSDMHNIIMSLRKLASTMNDVSDPMAARLTLERDLEAFGKAFFPAQREAAASFLRVMVYGLTERVVCDLNKDNAMQCVAEHLGLLARIFDKPLHMDHDIDRMERCNKLISDPSGGKEERVSDIECLANGVSKLQQLVNKMKDTATKAQLADDLDARPLPKIPVDMDAVNTLVSHELEHEFEAFISEVFRLITDVHDMGGSIHKYLHILK